MDFISSTTATARSSMLRQAASARYELEILQREHPARPGLERFIADGYRRAYGAHVVHFADVLLGLSRDREQWIGGVGYTIAGHRPLFVEQYVDLPIEKVLSRATGTSLSRQDVVEVGNLFAIGGGAARRIIVLMTMLLSGLGRSWCVLTLTRSLLNSFLRLGLEPMPLMSADPQRLQDKGASWGTYYSHGPRVMAISVASAFNRLGAANRFSEESIPCN